MSVYIRRLSVEEKLDRMRQRYVDRSARLNAHVVEQLHLEPTPSRRSQVLDEFPALTRRWAK